MADYSILASLLKDDVDCFIFNKIASTNDYLAKMPFVNKIQVCIAREQTHGKGQHGRVWSATKDSSILLSIRRNFLATVMLNGLSLVIAMAVIKVLEDDYDISQLKLKWPNDIYFNGKKLAGILLENKFSKNIQTVIIGLGLNNNLGTNFKCSIPFIDLKRILKIIPQPINLSVKLINKIIEYCKIFEVSGIGKFKKQWQQYDYLFNKTIKTNYQNKQIIGTAKGINSQGALLISTTLKRKIITIYSCGRIYLI